MRPRRGNGKRPNLERMERAAVLKAVGLGWADITRHLGIPHPTLMRWAKDPTFTDLVREAQGAAVDRLQRLAELLTVRQLEAGLKAKWTKQDAAKAAERILAPHRDGEGGAETGYLAHPGVVLLPMKDTGLESRPPTQVLMQPAAEVPAPPAPAPKPKRRPAPPAKGKRRVVGPDE